MSIYVTGKADLIGYISTAAGKAIAEQDVVFGTVTETSADEKALTNRNAKVRITMESSSSAAKGTEVVYYDRLDLSPLSLARLDAANLKNDATLADLTEVLRKNIGVKLTEDDVTMSEIIVDEGTGDRTVEVTAKSTSLGWFGEVILMFGPPMASIADDAPEQKLQGLNYPTDNPADTYGQVYLSSYDFTEYGLAIKALPVGVLSTDAATALVTTLKAVDVSSGSTLWNTTDGATAWSLSGAQVISNGVNTPDTLPTNPLYKYVMVLKLRDDVPKPKGVMYLHYNEPFDPTA